MLRKSWSCLMTLLLAGLTVSACIPEHPKDTKGTFAVPAEDGRPWRGLQGLDRSLQFPTGARISSRGDLANTARDVTGAGDAVAIESDDTVYIALHGLPASGLSTESSRLLSSKIRSIDPKIRHVQVAWSPAAFADLTAYARYLTHGRTVGGMLLTWRSIVRRHWGDASLTWWR